MRMDRGAMGIVLVAALLACGPTRGAERSPDAPSPVLASPLDTTELYRTVSPATILDSARALLRADPNVALVTVDRAGQPRVRTVLAFVDPPDATDPTRGFTVWIMTRGTTRKVAQIRANPRVTLYANDDARMTYATIMGTATVHTDAEHPGARRHYDAGYAQFFWPDFPRDFVMIEVRASWLEFMGPGVPNHREHWRPQAVVFEP